MVNLIKKFRLSLKNFRVFSRLVYCWVFIFSCNSYQLLFFFGGGF